jgi:hypothetical protein
MAKRIVGAVLVVAGILQVSTSFAQNGALDQRLARAQNVAIGFDTGLEFTAIPPTTEDREALYAVRRQIERSGRYWIVSNRKDAELLIAIRVRGVVDANSTKPVRRHGLAFRGERPTKADMLSVYDARYASLGVPLWSAAVVDGLGGDGLPLLAAFLEDVERLARRK